MSENRRNRMVAMLTFDHWVGKPVERRRKPDNIWTDSGLCVRYNGRAIGYLWTEWSSIDGDHKSVTCRRLEGEDVVQRSSTDTAGAAFELASEWVAKNQNDEELSGPDGQALHRGTEKADDRG